ncbi:MAG: Bro-N domain-containing protein [Candidatus Competibacter denitrificans]|jgi:hypothetical protein
MTALTLSFNNVKFDVVDRKGQPWLRGYQIGSALGYSQPDAAIAKLYDRNADEFTDSMTALVYLKTPGGKQTVRIFSLRGCHLLGMFARTAVAKEFRRWVLDVLDSVVQPVAVCNPRYHYPPDPFGQCGWLTLEELQNLRRYPLLDLLDQLKADGCNVDGARLEYRALRYHASAMSATLKLIAETAKTQLLRGVPAVI